MSGFSWGDHNTATLMWQQSRSLWRSRCVAALHLLCESIQQPNRVQQLMLSPQSKLSTGYGKRQTDCSLAWNLSLTSARSRDVTLQRAYNRHTRMGQTDSINGGWVGVRGEESKTHCHHRAEVQTMTKIISFVLVYLCSYDLTAVSLISVSSSTAEMYD